MITLGEGALVMTEYPFDAIYRDAPEPAAFARAYLKRLNDVLAGLDLDAVAGFVEILLDARERDGRIFFIGNGGSAATASHFANDLAIGTRAREVPFRAISLTDNNAVVTAIANDDGYDAVFVQQLEVLARPGDVVVAISASGNSPNVLRAVEWANGHDAITVGLIGFDGGKLGKLARHVVHVPSETGEYGPVEDAHMVLDHLIANYLISRLRAEGGRSDD
ncbi:MAG TPA: SIS domain-containing protein [Rhodospirillales bacterium]|nr:SIS domain-containing protein [Rhodospirillales bacterium]